MQKKLGQKMFYGIPLKSFVCTENSSFATSQFLVAA
jgi:hypothetical protein